MILQLVTFEVGRGCNLRHDACPCHSPERYQGVDKTCVLDD
jgi:hypothetical protein